MRAAFASVLLSASVLFAQQPLDELEADWSLQTPMREGQTRDDWRRDMLARRRARLAKTAAFASRWAYCRHYVMGGSHYAYTAALSDARSARTYLPVGSSRCLAE